jgi:hypothetical protein
MTKVTAPNGHDLGDITNSGLLAYYARKGYTIAGGQPAGAGEYDPAGHTVDEVVDYVTEHPDERQAIYDAELAARKPRSTLLEAISPPDDAGGQPAGAGE